MVKHTAMTTIWRNIQLQLYFLQRPLTPHN